MHLAGFSLFPRRRCSPRLPPAISRIPPSHHSWPATGGIIDNYASSDFYCVTQAPPVAPACSARELRSGLSGGTSFGMMGTTSRRCSTLKLQRVCTHNSGYLRRADATPTRSHPARGRELGVRAEVGRLPSACLKTDATVGAPIAE